MHSVGERIRQIRTTKGITQADLADALGTTTAAVSRYELGLRELRFEQVQVIAGVLGVSVFELYGFPSEQQIWIENTQKAVSVMRKYLQDNLDENPDEITRQVNEGIQLAADEMERQLKAEINMASVMHGIQVRANVAQQILDSQSHKLPQKITPVNKPRNKRLDNLITLFSEYPDDAQNRILEVMSVFAKLSSTGQKQAVKRVKELAELAKYQVRQESSD